MMALSGRRDDLAAAVGVHRRLLSAVALGALWTWSGADAAVVVSAAALTVGVVVALLPICDGRDHAATA
jgi:hypothetical protein